MYEAHAWLGLAETPYDIDAGGLNEAIAAIQQRIDTETSSASKIELIRLNGDWFITAARLTNRRRGEAEFLDSLLEFVARLLPGTWGLAYDRDDEAPEPSSQNRFRVRVIARCSVSEAADPFLSPIQPVIEDAYESGA